MRRPWGGTVFVLTEEQGGSRGSGEWVGSAGFAPGLDMGYESGVRVNPGLGARTTEWF